MTARVLPRASCRECGRRVPVVVPTRNGAGEVFRQHAATVGGTTLCPGSRTSVPITIPPPVRDLSYWTGPRTWEEAGL